MDITDLAGAIARADWSDLERNVAEYKRLHAENEARRKRWEEERKANPSPPTSWEDVRQAVEEVRQAVEEAKALRARRERERRERAAATQLARRRQVQSAHPRQAPPGFEGSSGPVWPTSTPKNSKTDDYEFGG